VYAEPWYRRYANTRPISLVVGVEQTLSQWQAFQSFWETTLAHGQKWFQLDLLTTQGTDSYTVNLTDWTVAPIEGTRQSIARLEMSLEALLLDPVASP
jgi:hypothetical protein